jgi:hypothetical protein
MTPTRNFTGSRTLPQGRSIGVNINLPNTCGDNTNNGINGYHKGKVTELINLKHIFLL